MFRSIPNSTAPGNRRRRFLQAAAWACLALWLPAATASAQDEHGAGGGRGTVAVAVAEGGDHEGGGRQGAGRNAQERAYRHRRRTGRTLGGGEAGGGGHTGHTPAAGDGGSIPTTGDTLSNGEIGGGTGGEHFVHHSPVTGVRTAKFCGADGARSSTDRRADTPVEEDNYDEAHTGSHQPADHLAGIRGVELRRHSQRTAVGRHGWAVHRLCPGSPWPGFRPPGRRQRPDGRRRFGSTHGSGQAVGRGHYGQGGSTGEESSDEGTSDDKKGPRFGGGENARKPGEGATGGRPVWAKEGIPEVELGRLSVARAPASVLKHAFDEVTANWSTIGPTVMTLTAEGQPTLTMTVAQLYSLPADQFAHIVQTYYDSIVRINSPLENLSLLKDVRINNTTGPDRRDTGKHHRSCRDLPWVGIRQDDRGDGGYRHGDQHHPAVTGADAGADCGPGCEGGSRA